MAVRLESIEEGDCEFELVLVVAARSDDAVAGVVGCVGDSDDVRESGGWLGDHRLVDLGFWRRGYQFPGNPHLRLARSMATIVGPHTYHWLDRHSVMAGT